MGGGGVARAQGAGEKPVWIRVPHRGRENVIHTVMGACGVVAHPVVRVLIPYIGVESPEELYSSTGGQEAEPVLAGLVVQEGK